MLSKRRRNKGQRGGQRRKKNNRRRNSCDVNIAKEQEEFQRERSKAQEEHDELRLDEIELSQCKALQRAKVNQEKVCTAVLVNVPFTISATELVNWLMTKCDLENTINNSYHDNDDNGGNPSVSPMFSCDILKHKRGLHRGKSSGKALIQMLKTCYNQLQTVYQTTGLILNGRRMKIFKGYQSSDQHDFHTLTSPFPLASVLVGHPSETDLKSDPSSSSIIPYYKNTTSKKLELTFHERERRQLSIQVGKNLRFEFDLHHLAQLRVGVNKDRKRTILLHFRLPPYCFRSKSASDAPPVDPIAAFFFHGVQDLDIYKDSYHWNVTEEQGANNDRVDFIRTTDPAKSTLGQCRTYQLVFKSSVRSREDNSLLRCFRDFAIKSTPDSSVFRCISDSYPPSFDPEYAWCGGFYKHFSGLDFSTRYLLHCMLSNSYLIIPSSMQGIQLANALRRAGTDISNEVLEYFISARFATSCENLVEEILGQDSIPTSVSTNTYGHSSTDSFEHDYDSDDFDDDNLHEILVQRVLVTPTRVCPQLPTFEQSNRILRKFHRHADRFLRVSFVEESFGSILNAISDDIVEKRLRVIMHNGIYVGGEHFVFLHYSSSQLRDQSCWFYNDAPSSPTANPAPTISDIRFFMGREDCHSIKVIGKHAARMGQGFSTSVPTTSIQSSQMRVIPDVERNGFCFSDGVGSVSPHLAEEVAAKLDLSNMVPSAFQIRIGGAKGVVSVYDGTYFKRGSFVSWLALRPSMIKFETDTSNDLEVLSYAKPMRSYLNRQIITVFSSLGIADDVFLSRLDDMVQVLSNCLTSTVAALEFAVHSTDENLVYEALSSGFDITKDRHLHGILSAQRNRFLLDLELKAKIYIPKGVNLLGILDETNTLEYGSIFFQYTDPTTKELLRLPAGTKVAVCRSPCIHPGDIRIVTVAETSEALEQWVNVVVFPQKGERPHPDEMSGGDLDGDIYSIYYDDGLIFSSNYPAMPVTPTSHLNKPKTTKTELVETIEIANFFVDYMQNDNLGRIANAHLALADALDAGAKDKICIEFAKLHSTAVDFAKTGIPAKFPPELIPRKYPDFMQNKTKNVYESKKALGKIYRTVKGLQITANVEDMVNDCVDESLVLPGSEQYLEDAQVTQLDYNQELFVIMRRYDLIDEQEVFSGFVKEFSSKMGSFTQRGNRQLQERLNREISTLRKDFRAIFWSDMEHDDDHLYEAMKKASAWYQVAYGKGHSGHQPNLISFPWVMSDLLCKIKVLSDRQEI